jgi:hypothetical protein|tara:strand:- start:76 stop:207 length:132 start_codon:yes stop_codon:yes gene_type:complete
MVYNEPKCAVGGAVLSEKNHGVVEGAIAESGAGKEKLSFEGGG